HAVLVVFKDAQKDALGTYREILFVRERNAREELWNGKREGLKGAESRIFDRIVSRNGFSRTAIAYENFDQVLIFELGEDVRNFKGDPYDLYDLQEQFKQKINYPSNFNSTRYRLIQKIRTTPIADAERLKQQIAYSVKYDSTLLHVPVI
ncbi:MAG: aminopeptidase P N-terminal domain-containing protein, partial [Flavobacteriales bacterium]